MQRSLIEASQLNPNT